MPGYLLHLGATVTCQHAGTAMAASPSPRVRVSGQPAVNMTGIWNVAGCPFNAGGAPLPCVTAQFVVAATRVRVGGAPALLQDSTAVCVPNGTGVMIVSTQTRVRGS